LTLHLHISTHLAAETRFPWVQLTYFSVKSVTLQEVIDAFAFMSALQVCNLTDCEGMIYSPTDLVHLPHLQTLELIGSNPQHHLIRYIIAPLLTDLKLEGSADPPFRYGCYIHPGVCVLSFLEHSPCRLTRVLIDSTGGESEDYVISILQRIPTLTELFLLGWFALDDKLLDRIFSKSHYRQCLFPNLKHFGVCVELRHTGEFLTGFLPRLEGARLHQGV
jgi:hypothetical protein